MTTDEKATFLRDEYIPLLESIASDAPMRWGKLSAQGIVEHMTDSVRIASAKDVYDPVHAPEITEKARAFMLSDRPFRENTTNPMLREEPADLRHASYADAVGELKGELTDFFDLFAQDRGKLVTNPIFGELDYDGWVHLLYKHVWHHLRQAGIEAPAV